MTKPDVGAAIQAEMAESQIKLRGKVNEENGGGVQDRQAPSFT
jgi:hypothetical protein